MRSMCGPHEAFCRLMVGTAIQPIREAQRSCLSVDAVASSGRCWQRVPAVSRRYAGLGSMAG